MWIKQAEKNIIFSISGWRTKIITPEPYILTAFYYGIVSFIQSRPSHQSITIAIGSDTRPFNKLLIELAIRTLETHNVKVINLGVIPGPAIMAYTHDYADGYIYFTASHNPPEYHGIKFGSHQGKTQDSIDNEKMMKIFHEYADSSNDIPQIVQSLLDSNNPNYETTINTSEYTTAINTYKSLVFQAIFKGIDNPTEQFKSRLQQFLKTYNNADNSIGSIGILWDPNGGARSWDVDSQILESLGIQCHHINSVAGTFNHPIVPENESLNQANESLLKLNQSSNTLWLLAVVCDCDGDRGNTIFTQEYLDTTTNSFNNKLSNTRILNAQEVFALTLQTELAWETNIASTPSKCPIAVVINGPSSLRCNMIAKKYNAKIFRSEVGEANVISTFEKLQNNYSIPIIGEASNGGVIIPPTSVRDPLCTVLSTLKSILWSHELQLHADITKTISQLPISHTTTTEDTLAKFQLPNKPYHEILSALISNFSSFFPNIQNIFNHFQDLPPIISYQFVSFQGVTMQYIAEHESNISSYTRSPNTIHSGGFAIYLFQEEQKVIEQMIRTQEEASPKAFLWLRPSGTEPVVRIMADVVDQQYSEQLERALIEAWRAYLQLVLFNKNQSGI